MEGQYVLVSDAVPFSVYGPTIRATNCPVLAHSSGQVVNLSLRPVDLGAAVRAEQIGQAMFEVTARAGEFENGDRPGTRSIVRYSDAYGRRQTLAERFRPWSQFSQMKRADLLVHRVGRKDTITLRNVTNELENLLRGILPRCFQLALVRGADELAVGIEKDGDGDAPG